jgi:hypothetical protein
MLPSQLKNFRTMAVGHPHKTMAEYEQTAQLPMHQQLGRISHAVKLERG